jgi:hypothetical protein
VSANDLQISRVAGRNQRGTTQVPNRICNDPPLNFHLVAVKVSGFFTPSGAGGAMDARRSRSGLRSRSSVAVRWRHRPRRSGISATSEAAGYCSRRPSWRTPRKILIKARVAGHFGYWPEATVRGCRLFHRCQGDKQPSDERVENDATDVVEDARSRHRMCQRVIVEQRITGGGRPHAG